MSNPKDWFRRRRQSLPGDEPQSDGLFPDAKLADEVFDLGRSAIMLRERSPLSIPPPPRPASRSGRVIAASAFATRPEIRPGLEPRPGLEARIETEPEQLHGSASWLEASDRRESFRGSGSAADDRNPLPEAASALAVAPAAAGAGNGTELRADGFAAFNLRRSAFRVERVPEPERPRPDAEHRFAAPEWPRPTAPVALPPDPPRAEKPAAAEFDETSEALHFPRSETAASAAERREPETRPADPERESDPSESANFTLGAPGPARLRGKTELSEASRVNALLRDAFTPTRPKQDASLFSGRFREMQRIIAAIEEERAHVVVYGERGSGKTSLSNVIAAKAGEAGYHVLRFACSTGITFEDIFASFLKRLPANFLSEGLGAGSRARVDNFEQLLPERPYGITELVEVFSRIHDRHVILIVDEYDRVTAEEIKNKLAELIKILSDSAAPVTLLLIGVADDVRDLFGKHPSLQRTLVTVPMPLMSRRELDGIVAAGEQRSGLSFAPEVRQAIVDFAQGLPYHAQLLCLFAARSAIRRQSSRIEAEDLRYAVERAAEEAESRIKEAYSLAIGAPEQSSFSDVLYFAARARSDEFGTFTAADVAAAGQSGDTELPLLSLQYPLKKLTEAERGAVLHRIVGTAGLRYQFSSQMMRHYVLTRQAAQRGLV